ncbi:MAG: flagellar hook-basal body complex protein FliE [Oribacterium sp.]|nr:flagellar hook-basal body complex protein FliE [Oribacterium sp.]MDY6316697.1 flagellar hook-basal body complex protein FliE [Oribacterium sp.]
MYLPETSQFITPMKSWSISDIAERAINPKNTESEGAVLFKDVFQQAVNNVESTQQDVENKQYLLATGQLEDTHSLPIAEAKAAVSLDLLITLRNKSLEAYQQLIQMQI